MTRILILIDALHKSDLNWAARSRHRFLAAPVAVGTVDQVLLGALTVKYAHVRQVAPACNLLVVDEVHASDPYMRGLLREIVQRRRATGGITLLMSATLGADLRSELLAPAVAPAAAVAGRRMLGGSRRVPQAREQDAASIIGEAVPYPILWLGPDNPVRLTDGPPVAKTVTILPCVDWPEDAVGDVAQKAIAAARAGARVLVIRNTVRLARATATAVSAIEPTMLLHLNNHPICHHARFAAQDRLALDGVLMAALNPDPAKRRGGLVAVTTQTAEQSLDVDADLLITDMVPADVLLQRIGRLHRNRSPEAFEARPAGFAEPRCIVLAPAESAALLAFASAPGRGPNAWGTDRAYADTLTLSATREMIGTGATWRIPEDNRRIVEGAISKAARHALAERSGAMGDEAERRVSARTMFQDERRREVSWSFHDNPDDSRFCERGLFETRADGMAATRLGLDDCRLELDPPFPSPFGSWMIGAVTVPGWLALALKLPGDSRATWRSSAEGVEITVEGHGARFSYGEFGLAPLEGGKSP